MTLPLKVSTYVTALNEAQEISLKEKGLIYLYRVNEGGYVIDNQCGAYSNEKLILTLKNGERQ